jgi:hypothetical protein
MMSYWLLISLFVLHSGLVGCSKPDPSSETVARTFFETWVRYTRDPDIWYQDKVFELVSKSTQAQLQALADDYNRARPQGVPAMQPSQMLMAKRPRLGTQLKSVDITEQTDEQVVLTLSFKRGKDTLTLVREDSGWKIDLPLPALRRP